MKFKLLKLFARVLLGKEVTLALTVLRLIAGAIQDTAPGELTRFVYQRLPQRWKSPVGPASESEFLDMISRGVDFYRSVRRVVT